MDLDQLWPFSLVAEVGLSALTLARQRRVTRSNDADPLVKRMEWWHGGMRFASQGSLCQCGGNSNIFDFHPENWGRFFQFDSYFFQMGWNHQLVVYIFPSFHFLSTSLQGPPAGTSSQPLGFGKGAGWPVLFITWERWALETPKRIHRNRKSLGKTMCVSGFLQMSGNRLEWLLHFQTSRTRILLIHDTSL